MQHEQVQRDITDLLARMLAEDGMQQTLSPRTRLAEQGIDSFRHLRLYVELERHFGIELTERMFSEDAVASIEGLATVVCELVSMPRKVA